MLKRIALLLAGVLVGLTVAVVVSTPAQAAPTCPVGHLCFFDASNWQGTKYVIANGQYPQNTCFNMGTDPNTGINWNDKIDSVWWNSTIIQGSTHTNFYKDAGCGGIIVTQAWADGHVDNQMQSCNEPVTEWNGACGSSGISSWKFWY